MVMMSAAEMLWWRRCFSQVTRPSSTPRLPKTSSDREPQRTMRMVNTHSTQHHTTTNQDTPTHTHTHTDTHTDTHTQTHTQTHTHTHAQMFKKSPEQP